MWFLIFVLCLLPLPLTVALNDCNNVTVSDKQLSEYLHNLSKGYHSWDRPIKNGIKPIEVYIHLVIRSIIEVVSQTFFKLQTLFKKK